MAFAFLRRGILDRIQHGDECRRGHRGLPPAVNSGEKIHMNFPDPIAVDPAEACRLTRVGHTRLYQAIGDGSLPAHKLGRKTVIRMSDLRAWIESLPRFEPRGARKELDTALEIPKAKLPAGRRKAAAARRERLRAIAARASPPP
jgi:excisionase family DNA binding protein